VRGVPLGGGGERENAVDVKNAAPLALEGADEQRAADTVTTHGLVCAAMETPPAVGDGPVPLAGRDRIDAPAERATMPMVA
jgi:hypothetical protein